MPMQSQRKVFISVAYTLNKDQTEFLEQILREVRQHGLEPFSIPQAIPGTPNPLQAIRAAIQDSYGTIVIAVARLAITSAMEFPNTVHAAPISPREQCSVWNHMEAAMTVQAGHPLFVLAQAGLYQEGILEPGSVPSASFIIGEDDRPVPSSALSALQVWLQSIRP